MVEKPALKINGFLGLLGTVVFFLCGAFLLSIEIPVVGIIMILIGSLTVTGYTITAPNEARVVVFFGTYIGTIKEEGFWLTFPFTEKMKVSLRVVNFTSDRLKVNDSEGNPVEIAAVVVYRVVDAAKSVFDVNSYRSFVNTQSETSIRNIASNYPYDDLNKDEGEEIETLRANAEEVAEVLQKDLQKRLEIAGIEIIEARIMHLAYAQEIAQAMLQRQQATAIVSARKKIVEGATKMAEEALDDLENNQKVTLTERDRVKIINNLLVSIVSEQAATPVINTSTV